MTCLFVLLIESQQMLRIHPVRDTADRTAPCHFAEIAQPRTTTMPFSLDLPKDIRMRQARRGPRMNCRVPVSIEWDASAGPKRFESAFTRVVNGYGCLLVSPREVQVNQLLRLTNLASRREVQGRVVWAGSLRPDGWDLGVEFTAEDLNFWGLDL